MLAKTVLRSLATEELHFKNKMLWFLLMDLEKKITELVQIEWEKPIKYFHGP
jgi:hypothetical protein